MNKTISVQLCSAFHLIILFLLCFLHTSKYHTYILVTVLGSRNLQNTGSCQGCWTGLWHTYSHVHPLFPYGSLWCYMASSLIAVYRDSRGILFMLMGRALISVSCRNYYWMLLMDSLKRHLCMKINFLPQWHWGKTC